MKNIFYNIFCQNYFLVFRTKEANYCWRVVSKKFSTSVALMVDNLVRELEDSGKTEVALIKIKKL